MPYRGLHHIKDLILLQLHPPVQVFLDIKDGKPYAAGDKDAFRRFPRYLELLFKAQGAEVCESEEEADIVLVMGKAEKEKEVSLTDANFFMT